MTSQLDFKLSVCIIAKNEALIIGRCLESIKPAADEIVVVDTGSEDNTIRIAESCGAQVISSDWRDDFSYSRNISIKHAKGDWILWLDADDIVPLESIPKIKKLKQEKPDKVFGMVVRNQKPNGTGTEFVQARMFPNHSSILFERPIHEQVMPSALRLGMKMVNTDVVIEHYGYAVPEEMKKKAQRNVSLLLKEAEKTEHDPFLLIEIADSYSIMEEQENAKVWYERVIKIPECEKRFPVIASQAYYGLGNIGNKSEEYDQAIEYFTKACKLCPERTDALYCLAVSQEMIGDKKRAADTLQQIFNKEHKTLQVGVDYRQSQIKAYLRLARILKELGFKAELAKLCQRALNECADRPEIQNMAGMAYYHLDNLMEALHCYERSIIISKESNIDAYIGLCVIYIKAGKREVAEKTIADIFPLFKDIPRYWAFCEISRIQSPETAMPEDISRNSIDNEKEYLGKTFGRL